MKIIKPSVEIEGPFIDGMEILKRIERYGRVCYKAEDKITNDSAEAFVAMIIKKGHHSVLEHVSATVRIICDRGVTHEIVRHRIASYSQESTRYCNYSKNKFGSEIAIVPMHDNLTPSQILRRVDLYQHVEKTYLEEIKEGVKPQQARDLLLTCQKTEIIVTYNLREWRHFFTLRTAEAAHPQMRKVVRPLLRAFRAWIPVVFDDVGVLE